MNSYHLRLKGQCLGPYSLDRIREMTRRGEVGRMHEVSTDGVSWALAETFPEIFERPTGGMGMAVGDASTRVAGGQPSSGAATPAPAPVAPGESQWYCDRNGSPVGPMPLSQLVAMIQRGDVNATTFVFKDGAAAWTLAGESPELLAFLPGTAAGGGQPGINAFCRECGAGVSSKAVMCPKCGAPTGAGLLPPPSTGFDFPMGGGTQRPPGERRSKTVAAVLALLIGGFGIHHFYLGNAMLGVLYLLLCWTLLPALIAFVEAIVFLCMSDEAFDRKYNS